MATRAEEWQMIPSNAQGIPLTPTYPFKVVPKVYSAIVQVMRQIGKEGISKGRRNQQQGYQFRGIDDVYNALSGLLSAAQLVILPRVLSRIVTERETKAGGVLFYVVLEVAFDFVSAEDGSVHTAQAYGEAMDSGDKATNKAMSAAYKYACMEVFCIPTEGNPDADAETHEVAPREVLLVPKAPNDDIDEEAVAEAANKMHAALYEGDLDERIRGLKCLDLHEVLNAHQEIYQAAAQMLPAKDRAAWKTYVSLAKAAEKADKAASGKRF
jgi:hypothetical protein